MGYNASSQAPTIYLGFGNLVVRSQHEKLRKKQSKRLREFSPAIFIAAMLLMQKLEKAKGTTQKLNLV